jgi:glyoxylase I family protein
LGVERVTGIGGVFLRSTDPDRLGRWYAEHLGVDPPPGNYDDPVWEQEAGPTVWAIIGADADMFGRPDQQWMVNFRVRDLGAMVDQLRAVDIAVQVDPERYPNGRFARLDDPDGNPIQLWQPS